jgi:hypothetical protein
VIDKIRKGNNARTLLDYLFGPGRSDEHRDQHIVAGWRNLDTLEPPIGANGKRDLRDLADQINALLAARGRLGQKGTVWHCVLSAAPDDPLLSDEQWNAVAAEFMHQMGLAPRDDPMGVRWVAVRHGLSKDGIHHVHIVAALARQDGQPPSIHRDFVRARKACLAIEKQFGLRATAAADCTAVPRPSRAEQEQAARNGRSEPTRVTLRRIVQDAAAGAVSEDDFLARVRDAGARIRLRNSADQPGRAAGYAVCLPPEKAGTRTPVWFSGGKLAPDLTLPKLRRRWEHPATASPGPHPAARNQPRPSSSLEPKSVRAFLRSAACSAAEQARNEHGFFRLLDDAGILVRYRYSTVNPGEVTDYSLSVPGHGDEHGDPNWYSGGRLSDTLSLPRLRHRWDARAPGGRLPVALSPEERHAIWADVIRLTREGADELHRLAPGDPAAASDVAWATADALRASARAIGGVSGRKIRRSADDFERAARATYRTVPRPTVAGNGLRTASRLLGALRSAAGPVRIDVLLENLIALIEETARLRDMQARVHQAIAARTAAERLTALRRDPALRPERPTHRIDPEQTPSSTAAGAAARLAQTDQLGAARLLRPVPVPLQPGLSPQVPRSPAAHQGKPRGAGS